ncbi:Os04g0576400 [Oryza sativa Japonica Group]|uniref:Os04g0576400 protein n=1 Tax=Oryza sativa subsp. japonica TaxID=39947 RepID=Q0JAU9_ORYSJ|nr:Os04g0576400 [Oryza sativa Japonica Group]|eukprot:NP_001053624.1 Os04g0576400 [Oryza sativa Japonica Group]
MSGRRWNMAPVSASSARAVSAAWKRATQTYSLPAPCCDLTRRVARSTQTMRLPVTLGSSVPLCPVLLTRRRRLIHATTQRRSKRTRGGRDGYAAMSG